MEIRRLLWFSPKSVIVGHRIWWDCEAGPLVQASIRAGFVFGLVASMTLHVGSFDDVLARVASMAATWALVPGMEKWLSMSFVRHERGPHLDTEEA